MTPADITGQTFARLTVAGMVRADNGRPKLRCTCTCGREVDVYRSHLLNGLTQSCGCLRAERSTETAKQNAKHGKWRTNEFDIWQSMRSRCHRPADEHYPNYGGRGIVVCDRWRFDFAAFLSDMGPRPSRAHSLERTNNERGYEPGNVVWATMREQQNNKRTNVRVTFDGETLTATQLARKYSLNANTVLRRIKTGRTGADLIAPPDRTRRVFLRRSKK